MQEFETLTGSFAYYVTLYSCFLDPLTPYVTQNPTFLNFFKTFRNASSDPPPLKCYVICEHVNESVIFKMTHFAFVNKGQIPFEIILILTFINK